MPGRAALAALLVVVAFALDGFVIAGLFWIFTNEVKIDPATFGTLCGFLGTIVGAVNALAGQPVSWAFGSTVGSARKDETISTMAGKG